MEAEIYRPTPNEISVLLRGESERMVAWISRLDGRRLALHLGVILMGAGLYGAAMGWWRDPVQALYSAIKFPLIILLTTAGNALINAMVAPLLGLNIPFRQTCLAVLMSFTIAAAILGAFSPLMAFLLWNAPPMSPQAVEGFAYSFIKLANVAIIAFAGVTGNTRLFQLLARLGGDRKVAMRVMVAWLVANLFFGSQLSWMLRPFIGAPNLPVEFFRAAAFRGNIFENCCFSIQQMLKN